MAVPAEDIELTLRQAELVPWSDFLLNPRRLRGSDFLMRWSQGRWSEDLLVQAVNRTSEFFTIPYGPSGTAPDDAREFELYFERLEHAGLGKVKRPDLLVFPTSARTLVEGAIAEVGGAGELPFRREDDPVIARLLKAAIVAVECENSLWKSKQMPHYGIELTPQRRLKGKLGVKKGAVLPTVIIKEEDRAPLVRWQRKHGVPIHVWHVFYDQAYGLSLDRAEQLVRRGLVDGTTQTFQAPGGATTKKVIYKFPYHYAYPLAETTRFPRLEGRHIEDKNGHILPYVSFVGGELSLSGTALDELRALAGAR